MEAASDWLDTPVRSPLDELADATKHLAGIEGGAPPVDTHLPERLVVRGLAAVGQLIPELVGSTLPLSARIRSTALRMQNALETFAGTLERALQCDTGGLPQEKAGHAGRLLQCFTQHLLISKLVAAPPSRGSWLSLHRANARLSEAAISARSAEDGSENLRATYLSALLLGCAQPVSFSSSEIGFITVFLQRFGATAHFLAEAKPSDPGAFWLDTTQDRPPDAAARKIPPVSENILHFSASPLASLIESQLAALGRGETPAALGLPEYAGTPAGRATLHRLANYWGRPAKRRFQRRRQNDRARLCIGEIEAITCANTVEPPNSSEWMIVNESADGYALMHLSGKPGSLAVGGLASLRSNHQGAGPEWQACVIRWALSQNSEHLELGLQILAPRAMRVELLQDAGEDLPVVCPALLLPALPPLQLLQRLVLPRGHDLNPTKRIVLVLAAETTAVREISIVRREEQTAYIDILLIQNEEGP